jgi:hypothetical protein
VLAMVAQVRQMRTAEERGGTADSGRYAKGLSCN